MYLGRGEAASWKGEPFGACVSPKAGGSGAQKSLSLSRGKAASLAMSGGDGCHAGTGGSVCSSLPAAMCLMKRFAPGLIGEPLGLPPAVPGSRTGRSLGGDMSASASVFTACRTHTHRWWHHSHLTSSYVQMTGSGCRTRASVTAACTRRSKSARLSVVAVSVRFIRMLVFFPPNQTLSTLPSRTGRSLPSIFMVPLIIPVQQEAY